MSEDRQTIIEALRQYDIKKSPSWSELEKLSHKTDIDGVDVDPAGIILEKEQFRGVANVYVLLAYDGKKKSGLQTSDSFLGRFRGHFDDQRRPIIDDFSIDTSPFYEGEKL